VLLTVSGLSLEPASPFGTPLRHIGFEVRRARCWASAGWRATGRMNCWPRCRASGPWRRGMIEFKGDAPIGTRGPRRGAPIGLLCAPEERLGHAAAPDMSLTENAVLTGRTRRGLDRSGFVGWGGRAPFAEEIIARFDVRTPGPGVRRRARCRAAICRNS
jgi:ABC-type uncharacterized transport system ATPase subunit